MVRPIKSLVDIVDLAGKVSSSPYLSEMFIAQVALNKIRRIPDYSRIEWPPTPPTTGILNVM